MALRVSSTNPCSLKILIPSLMLESPLQLSSLPAMLEFHQQWGTYYLEKKSGLVPDDCNHHEVPLCDGLKSDPRYICASDNRTRMAAG